MQLIQLILLQLLSEKYAVEKDSYRIGKHTLEKLVQVFHSVVFLCCFVSIYLCF